jgi:putative transposase
VKWRDGCFAQDAVGDWYLCLPVREKVERTVAPKEAAGFDLGLETTLVASDGWRAPRERFTEAAAKKLAQLQRPKGTRKDRKRTLKSKRITRLHRKVARQRKDYIQKVSTTAVKRYQKIVVGGVSSLALVKTRMAKSVLDAGWGMLKEQLRYKCQKAGRSFEVVDERDTTRACSDCGALTGSYRIGHACCKGADSARKCGTEHNRDVKSSRNILTRAQVSGCKPGDCEPERGVRQRKRGVYSGSTSRRARHLADARHGGDVRSGAS